MRPHLINTTSVTGIPFTFVSSAETDGATKEHIVVEARDSPTDLQIAHSGEGRWYGVSNMGIIGTHINHL